MEALFKLSILFTLFLSFHGINVEAQNPPFDSIYQFGDSMSDTGNNVHVQAPDMDGCSKPPYGETFFQHPTGRCSNGLLVIDFIAMQFKIPLLSPILDKSGNFRHGANFAVKGATALTTSETSLLHQLDWFKSHLATICSNPTECKHKLGNALFAVGEIGGNDYNTKGFAGAQNPSDLRSITPKVVQTISYVVQQLIDLGATRLVVPGNYPFGCTPIYLTAYKTNDPTMYDELGCLKSWNDLAAYHNDQLQMEIRTLQNQHPEVKIAYGDNFAAVKYLFQNAATLGFDKDSTHKACCGDGNNEYNFGGAYCGNNGANLCPNADVLVSWDGIHMTQHAYYIIAQQLMNGFVPKLS